MASTPSSRTEEDVAGEAERRGAERETPPHAPLGDPAAPPGAEELAALRARLEGERAAVEGSHRAGASGAAVVRALTELVDGLVVELAGGDALPYALVALGGYGRRELAPHSDVDLMFLHDARGREDTEHRARAVFQTLWDLRLNVGNSVRTVHECLALAARDLPTRSALMEGRLLLGRADLYRQLVQRLRARATSQRDVLVRMLAEEMERATAKHGYSLYMLEPNVKKSGGGLRTIHFIRWIALARHGTADLGVLHARGLLTSAEGRALREAQEFYWRVRNDLHFRAGHAADTVSFADQLRLASLFGFRDEAARRGVETFMQQYYIHATQVADIAERLVSRTLRKSARRRALERVLSRTVDEIFVLTPGEIGVSASGRERLLSDPERTYALFHLAQLHGRKIRPEVLDAVRQALEVQDEAGFRAPAVVRRFLDVLSSPRGIADTFSVMHRSGALAKLLPEFRGVNRLVEYSRTHAYTVDEHTLMVLRKAEGLLTDGDGEGSEALRKAYREIKRKDILHLAILLHDIGKGRAGSHSAAGAEIAAIVARRVGYDEHDTRLLVHLVRQHLTMANLALRRDLGDDKLLMSFARVATNPETLRMLFVLTYADIAGVAPGSWTRWKEDLLTTLYLRTMDELTGSREVPSPAERLEYVGRELRERLRGRFAGEWLETQLAAFDDRTLLATPPEDLVRQIEWLAELSPGDVLVKAVSWEDRSSTEYTVLTFDRPGLFCHIAGVLAAKGLQILRARVDTTRGGVAIDSFEVTDTFFSGMPPAERLDEVKSAIRDVLLGRIAVEELFARHRRYRPPGLPPAVMEPTKVEVDNDSSDHFTILEVFAQDKQGLLYVIAKTLWDLGLSVHSSKVATRLDQILDVFYITDASGRRIVEPERLETISHALVERIDAYEREEG